MGHVALVHTLALAAQTRQQTLVVVVEACGQKLSLILTGTHRAFLYIRVTNVTSSKEDFLVYIFILYRVSRRLCVVCVCVCDDWSDKLYEGWVYVCVCVRPANARFGIRDDGSLLRRYSLDIMKSFV